MYHNFRSTFINKICHHTGMSETNEFKQTQRYDFGTLLASQKIIKIISELVWKAWWTIHVTCVNVADGPCCSCWIGHIAYTICKQSVDHGRVCLCVRTVRWIQRDIHTYVMCLVKVVAHKNSLDGLLPWKWLETFEHLALAALVRTHKHEKLPQNRFYCVHNEFM